ncbi:cullin-1-like [Solanum dulcamara]|uniref:cullin-1-like n=1 Tax=Solanum dulcamara TaxID=45834 RepID=UPI002485A3C6|nr:cullin-1-like [Solanum dulcamara]
MSNAKRTEESVKTLEEGITKVKLIMDGYPACKLFTSEEYMRYYNSVYLLCIRPPPHDLSAELLQRYHAVLDESVYFKVLPFLKDKSGASLLAEFLRAWTNYKAMVKCLGGFFLYLDKKCTDQKSSAPLKEVALSCFQNRVCCDFLPELFDAALLLVSQDRKEEPIDRSLLQGLSTFFWENGGSEKGTYYYMFEEKLLADTSSCYSRFASEWLLSYSSTDYILKVERCLNDEKGKLSQYMYPFSVEKLLQVVHLKLIGETTSQLIEKKTAENLNSTRYQELLSRCSNLSIG